MSWFDLSFIREVPRVAAEAVKSTRPWWQEVITEMVRAAPEIYKAVQAPKIAREQLRYLREQYRAMATPPPRTQPTVIPAVATQPQVSYGMTQGATGVSLGTLALVGLLAYLLARES